MMRVELKDIGCYLSLIHIYGAHVIGTSYKGRMNGSIADMTTMSFHPVKTVTGGEGGAVLTNSKEYYAVSYTHLDLYCLYLL